MGHRAAVLGLLFLPLTLFAQERRFYTFSDKAGTPHTLAAPSTYLSARAITRRTNQGISLDSTDLPVSPTYLGQIQSQGGTIVYTSKWLNGALVEATGGQHASIATLPFIQSDQQMVWNSADLSQVRGACAIEQALTDNPLGVIDQDYLCLDQMHADGYQGQGYQIAVFDEGFLGTDLASAFNTMFTDGRVLGTYDFVDGEADVYNDDPHGTWCLSLIGAEGSVVGSAPKAEFYLFRTEDVVSESRLEEVYWLVAAEHADSAGVDAISSSVGYNTFDNSSLDHVLSELDGQTAIVSRAADLAGRKGILVVNSAGNEGGNAWNRLLFPADAQAVISVGSTGANGQVSSFSSRGPTADGRTKPDVSAWGEAVPVINFNGSVITRSGTSFAAPQVAGLGVGLWQKYPTLTAAELRDLIRGTGTRNSGPNNEVGAGWPNYCRAEFIFQFLDAGGPDGIVWRGAIYPNPFEGTRLTLVLDPAEVGGEVTLKIRNSLGQTLADWSIQNAPEIIELSLPYGTTSQGIYFLRMETALGGRTLRLARL